MRLRLVLLVICALLLAPVGFQAASARVADPVRALWVTRTALASPSAVAQMVRTAKDGGFNTLLVQVRGRGDAYYDSAVEPRAAELAAYAGFDPLAATLEQAHAAGMSVHAWIAVNLVASAHQLPASRNHIVYRSPEWLMVPRALAAELAHVDPRSPEYLGRLTRWTRTRSAHVEGLFTSPLQPGAVDHTAAVVKDLVERYAVDGVHLDYVRFPGEDFDYSKGAVEQFKQSVLPDLSADQRRQLTAREALDPLAYLNFFPERWGAFRRSRLTALVMRMRTVVKTARPTAIVSAAVVPDATVAAEARFQDWRTWLDQSLVDVVCPMIYTTDPRAFEQQVTSVTDYAGGHAVWAGIGAYRLSTVATLQHIAASSRLGAAGIVLFSYDSLIAPPNNAATLTELGRSAFAAGSQ